MRKICDFICFVIISVHLIKNVIPAYVLDQPNLKTYVGTNITTKIDSYNIAIIRIGFVNENGTEIYSYCNDYCLHWKMREANEYFKDSSDDKFSFDINNSIVISIQINKTMNNTINYNVYSGIAVDILLNQHNIDILDKYKHKMFIYPDIGYDWGGLGNIGCSANYCSTWIMIPQESKCLNFTNRLCHNTIIVSTMIHELFHNLGLYHASTVDDEYGDVSDVMGGTTDYLPPKLNFPHLYQLGWINISNVMFNPTTSTVLLRPISHKQSNINKSDIIGVIIDCKCDTIFISYRTIYTDTFDVNLLNDASIYIHKFSGKNTILMEKIPIKNNDQLNNKEHKLEVYIKNICDQ